MSKAPVILHMVYVHGFQGDHTTFQSFPTDLHHVLQPQLPAHIQLRSTLYPTYKSRRPITVATQNFLKWLEGLPLGPVILCGHSMGGLLIAEAVTSTHAASKRVIALLAFDVPFLGMHPHVVISGIASLLADKNSDSKKHADGHEKAPGEMEINGARHVEVPGNGPASSPHAPSVALPLPALPAPRSRSALSLAPPALPSRPASTNQPDSSHGRSPSPAPVMVTRALDCVQSHSNNPLVRFLIKHKSDPLTATKRWVVESFEFGVCMFDPLGLRARYAALEKWPGEWVAFWTETVSRQDREVVGDVGNAEARARKEDDEIQERNATAWLETLLEPSTPIANTDSPNGPRSLAPTSSLSPYLSVEPAPTLPSYAPPMNTQPEREAKVSARQHGKELWSPWTNKDLQALRKQHKPGSPHHFVVCPFTGPSASKHRWEKVKIRGARDEVEAHCGLFLRNLNLEYVGFVERVRGIVKEWVERFDAS